MKKLFLILAALFVPSLVWGAAASDFTIHDQPTYDVPPGSFNVLALDLTLPEILRSITIDNAGTAQQYDISKLTVYEDGVSAGWDGDEREIMSRTTSPFFDANLIYNFFSSKRIFVTINISSSVASGRTVKLQLKKDSLVFFSGETGPTDEDIFGPERKIVTGALQPSIPVSPLPGAPEVLSSTAIRWHFTDLSNNEFGFKILDGNLNTVAKTNQAGLSYLDETGLSPGTTYSGRRVIAFNDQGNSPVSFLFPEATTLVEEAVEEPAVEEPPVVEEPVVEEPIVEEPVVEEPVVEEPIIEEPVVEEPVIEKPVEPEEVKEELVQEPEEPEEIVEPQEESSKEETIEKTPLFEAIKVKILEIRETIRNIFNQLFSIFKR